MATPGKDNTLTVDANVVSYCWQMEDGCALSQGLPVTRIADFKCHVLDRRPIAVNRFVEDEYAASLDPKRVKDWLKHRFQAGLAIEVERIPLPRTVRTALRDHYGFDCCSRDRVYLETCLNTYYKYLVTENRTHFDRPHCRPKQRNMRAYLFRKLRLCVRFVDECCAELIDGAVSAASATGSDEQEGEDGRCGNGS